MYRISPEDVSAYQAILKERVIATRSRKLPQACSEAKAGNCTAERSTRSLRRRHLAGAA